MEPIRYLPRSDLAVSFYVDGAKSLLCQMAEKDFFPNIDDIVSISNILRYMNDGLDQQLGNPDRIQLRHVIVEFCQSNGPNGVLNYFNQLSRWLDDDFWQFIVSFGLEKNLEEEDFGAFLSSQKPDIGPILIQKPLHYCPVKVFTA